MSVVNNKFITRRMPWHANMTDMNHLGAALIAKPHVMEGKIDKLFTSELYSENSLFSTMIKEKREETISKSEWEWQMRGATCRPLISKGPVDSNQQPGKFKQNFKIKLEENWWIPGDVIVPSGADKKFQVRIQENCYGDGTSGYVYTVRLMADDPQAFMPTEFLTAGKPWIKLFSQYEEAAEQSGSTVYSLPLTLANRMSRYRKKYRVTGDAANEVLSIAIPDSKGNYHKSWIKYAEVEYWQQWYKELEIGMWYSRSTNTVLGANGRPIYTGPGIQEMLEQSHIHYYSHLSARLMEEYIMDIFYSRVRPGKGRKLKVYTGEYGMIQFHRMVQNSIKTGGSGFFTIMDTNFISKTSSEYHENSLAYGYQFTKYRMGNGAEVEVIHNPLYDDITLNSAIDPVTGFPKESQRFTFLDFGQGADSNIKIMRKANSTKLGYVSGLHNPYGPTNNKMMSHSGDYYEMHVQTELGVHIHDIGRCGELILSRN